MKNPLRIITLKYIVRISRFWKKESSKMKELLKNSEWEKSMAMAEELVTEAITQKRFGLLQIKKDGITITANLKPFRKVKSVEDIMELLQLESKRMEQNQQKRPATDNIENKKAKLAKMGTDDNNIATTHAMSIEQAEKMNEIESEKKDALKRQSITKIKTSEPKKVKK